MKTPETTARLADLAERIRNLEAVFSCGGTITLPAPVTLLFADGRSIRVVREKLWTRTIGRKLMARCQPASFGVGRRTYHDRRVRDGGQLLARDGALRASGLDLSGAGILTEIGRTLCPGDRQNPVAELYALNVYGARGQRRLPDRGHYAQALAQYLLTLGIAPDRTKQVREVHVRRRELRLQHRRRPIRCLGEVNAAHSSLERPEGDLGFRAFGVGGL
jgi:hypothetical protein